MPRLPDDIPDIWHRQWLARQSPEVRKQYAESDALAAELAGERPAFVGLTDAPMFPGQRFDAPPAPAAPLPRGEEVDPVERARLNVVDSFYRGTLAGATILRKLAALGEAPDDPQPDDVTRAEQGVFGSALPGRDQLRAEYRRAIADLQKFDRIRPSASLLDYAATAAGQIVGGIPTPESAVPLGRGATLFARAVKAGAWTAGVNVATDPIVQNLSIGSKVQKQYDWTRTAAAAPIGFVIGAGVGPAAKAGVNAVDGAARWVGSRFERQSHPRVSVQLASPGTGKSVANDPSFAQISDLLASAAGEAGDAAKGATPQEFGKSAHTGFAERAEVLKLPGDLERRYRVRVEESYIDGRVVGYNKKSSIRPDVVLYEFVTVRDPEGRVIAVFDLKTGHAGLDAERIRKLQNAVRNREIPDAPDVPVIQIDYHKPAEAP